MPGEIYKLAAFVGLVFATSWCCWAIEQLKGLHPAVKFGLQAASVGLSSYAVGRMLHLI